MDNISITENGKQNKLIIDYDRNGLLDILTKSNTILKATEDYLEANWTAERSKDGISRLKSFGGKLSYLSKTTNPKKLSEFMADVGISELEQKDKANMSKYSGAVILKGTGYAFLGVIGFCLIFTIFARGLWILLGILGAILFILGIRGYVNTMVKPLIKILEEKIIANQNIAETSSKVFGGSVENARNSFPCRLIPPDYSYSFAIETMLSFLHLSVTAEIF